MKNNSVAFMIHRSQLFCFFALFREAELRNAFESQTVVDQDFNEGIGQTLKTLNQGFT